MKKAGEDMAMFFRLMCVSALVSAAACAGRTELRPAETAMPIGTRGAAAIESDVRLVARADAWDGELVRHFDDIIPIQVTVENNGDVPLAIRYQHFPTDDGGRHQQRGASTIRHRRHADRSDRADRSVGGIPVPTAQLRLAPYRAPYYPGLVPFDGQFVYDRRYYGRYYPRWVRVQLPTPEMLRKALPEGVLRPDGSMRGFLYLDRPDHLQSASLTFDLVNAFDDRRIGPIGISFVARED